MRFYKDGKLLIFSEKVGVNELQNALVIEGEEFAVGEELIGSAFEELEAFECGGKKYPAKHLLAPGLNHAAPK